MTMAIFTNSEGWSLPITGRTIQRLAPNLETPNFHTATNASMEPIYMGIASFVPFGRE